MKKLLSLAAGILACALSAEPIELLPNRDFSKVENGKIIGWRVNNAGTFTAKSPTASYVFVPHSWGYNMLFSNLNGVNAVGPGQPMRPKATYRFSVRAKGKGSFYLACMLQNGKTGNWQFIRTVSSKPFPLSEKFTDYDWKYTVDDPNVTLGQFSIMLGGGRMEFENPSMTFDPEENQSIQDPGFALPKKLSSEVALPVYKLPFLEKAPVLDGAIGNDEYRRGIQLCGVFAYGSPIMIPTNDLTNVASDGETLYLAVKSPISPEKLKVYDGKDNFADALEILINPGTQTEPGKRIYQIVIDGKGAMTGYQYDWTKDKGQSPWKVQGIKNVFKTDDGFWTTEISVSLKELGITKEMLRKGIGIQIVRDWSNLASGTQQSQISYIKKLHYYETPATIPLFRWADNVPAVAELRPAKKVHTRTLNIFNPGQQSCKLNVKITLKPQYSQPSFENKTLEIAPGQSAEVSLSSVASLDELCHGKVEVRNAADDTLVFEREFYLRDETPGKYFRKLNESGAKLKYAYYRTSGKAAAEIDLAAARPASAVSGIKSVKLQVQDPDGKVIAETIAPVVSYALARKDDWQLPELPVGTYKLTASFGGSGIPAVSGTFPVQKFEWENNKIGMSDILLPGFTPVKLDGNTYETVLRVHQFNKCGLFDSVKAKGHELLASPMVIRYTKDGKSGIAEGKSLTWKKVSPTRLEGEGTIAFGDLTANYKVTAEYDGCVLWEFFYPQGKVDSIQIEIPVVASEANLMHTLADTLRGQYSGYIPSGKGIIWRGSKNYRVAIPAPFIPYIWVGGIERGFSAASASGKNWKIADGAETQELVFDGKSYTIIERIASAPVTGDGKTSVTLCFQATPVKERPADYRKYTFGLVEYPVGKKYNMPLLGQGRYWAAETACEDVYPRDRDMSVLYKMKEARDTGKIDTEFFEKWIAGYTKLYATASDPMELAELKRRTRTDLMSYPLPMLASLKPQNITFYTNGRGVRLDTPEAKTYLNEWCRTRFPVRDWGYARGDSYILDPVATYRDFAAWYLLQMSKAFMDVIYIDDIFLSPNFNMESSDAWRDAKGVIHPDCGLYNMRELLRRCSMLIHEQNRPVLTMAHMTDTSPIPILSFAYTQYCWEFGRDNRPYQERTTRASIQAIDTGIQAGTISFGMIMDGRCTPEEKLWVERTAIGVALTHDIKLWTYSKLYERMLKMMFAFGYTNDNVPVYVYYEPGYPIQVKGIESSSLGIRNGKEMLLFVCDWKDGGTASITLDSSLGLGKITSAVDAETGAALTVKDNVIELPIKKFDFRVIKITGEK